MQFRLQTKQIGFNLILLVSHFFFKQGPSFNVVNQERTFGACKHTCAYLMAELNPHWIKLSTPGPGVDTSSRCKR